MIDRVCRALREMGVSYRLYTQNNITTNDTDWDNFFRGSFLDDDFDDDNYHNSDKQTRTYDQ